jgi:hypothetical protein
LPTHEEDGRVALDLRPQPVPNKISLFYEGRDPLVLEYTRLLEYNENLEELANWYLRNSIRPQPGIILAAIISTCSVLIGRRLVLFRSKANVYTVVISGTSTGKNAVFTQSKNLIKACGCEHVIGADAISSGEGVLTELRAKPEILWPLDEIQDMMKNISSNKATAYAINIAKYLKTMFSGQADFKERVLGSDKEGDQKAPLGEIYPVVLSAAQPLSFWGNVSKNMVADGFIPRFLAFTGDDDTLIDSQQLMDAHTATIAYSEMPKGVIEKIKAWTYHKPAPTLMEMANVPGTIPTTKVKGADSAFQFLQQRITDIDSALCKLKQDDLLMAELFGKNTEYLVKLSAISAWIRNPADPTLMNQDVEWATRIIQASNSLLRSGFLKHSPTNEFEKNLVIITESLSNSPEGLTKNAISAKLRGVSSYNLDHLLLKLTEMGDVVVRNGPPDENGRRERVYYHFSNLDSIKELVDA